MEDNYDEEYNDNNDEEYVDERDLLMEALTNVDQTIMRYVDMVDYLWSEKLIPFIESDDCSIMDRLDRSNSRKFYEMMYRQPIYIEMINSRAKILNKLERL